MTHPTPSNVANPAPALSQDALKTLVGQAALKYVVPGELVGVGTGSTVNQFISARTDTNFIYLLGCLPQFMIPYDTYHYLPIQSGGTHAVVYSRQFRDQSIKEYTNTIIEDWDVYCKAAPNRYTYHEPLAYQLFPVTENSMNWFESEFLVRFAHYYIRFFRLDVNVEPGYSIFYTASKALYYILMAALLGLLGFVGYMLISRFKKLIRNRNR